MRDMRKCHKLTFLISCFQLDVNLHVIKLIKFKLKCMSLAVTGFFYGKSRKKSEVK